mmetsp:Transcript_15486/g.50490  ORF Transcript_15486/g.50490 Transcript_15486/m.50490 type:complete len:263 (-) Transcript_15486:44-832(-)
MAFWLQKPAKLLPPDQCNPGRATPNPQAAGPDALHYTKQTRLCEPFPEGLEVAIFGFGCFWCSEGALSDLDGIYSTSVGYAGGVTENPTYRDVCGGDTNHNEVVRVVFDPSKLPYAELLRVFWSSHNPCTLNRQGNDRGTQYRSGFYYFDDDQKALIEASMKAYEAQLGRPITTEVAAASDYDQYGGLWFYGEQYHQQYLAKPGSRPYCSAQPQGVDLAPFESWCPPGLESYAPKLPEAFWDAHKPRKGCSVVNAPNEPVVM